MALIRAPLCGYPIGVKPCVRPFICPAVCLYLCLSVLSRSLHRNVFSFLASCFTQTVPPSKDCAVTLNKLSRSRKMWIFLDLLLVQYDSYFTYKFLFLNGSAATLNKVYRSNFNVISNQVFVYTMSQDILNLLFTWLRDINEHLRV